MVQSLIVIASFRYSEGIKQRTSILLYIGVSFIYRVVQK